MHRSSVRSIVSFPLLICGVLLAASCGGATSAVEAPPSLDQGAGSAEREPAPEEPAVVQVPPVPAAAQAPSDTAAPPPTVGEPPSKAAVHPCPAERNMTPATIPERIEASHIVVSYLGAMKASPLVRRSKEEARARAQEVLTRLCQGANFADMVRAHSDEPGAGDREGKLGRFRHRMMVKPFADAAFALLPGELSPVVETGFGFHIILRTK